MECRRLSAVSRHLRAADQDHAAQSFVAGARNNATALASSAAPMMKLLTDSQVREFIVNGVLTLPVADVSQDVHDRIHADAERLFNKKISLGNNIYPGLAGLEDVMESATVRGALTSLLGADYTLHPHRAFHNSTTQGDQTFHKDTQRGKVKGFRPRWVMALYVPAGCTAEMGPTAVVPQSHYLCNDGVGLSYLEGRRLEGKDAKWCHLSDPSRANDPSALAPFLREEKCTAPLRVGSVTFMHVSTLRPARQPVLRAGRSSAQGFVPPTTIADRAHASAVRHDAPRHRPGRPGAPRKLSVPSHDQAPIHPDG